MKKICLILLIALLSPAASAFAQGGASISKSGTAAATFLEIPVGAQAIGMGSAYVSLAKDASALYWNVAGIAALPQSEILADHTAWIADTKLDFAALVLPLGGFGTIGFSFTSLSMSDMKVRTVEMPEGTGEYFSAADMALGVSYARQLTDRFGVGFTAKYIQQTIWHESANAFAVDFGTTFKTDLFGGMTIGASLTNFGTSMTMSGIDTRMFGRVDPTKQGSNDQIPQDIEMNSWDLPLMIQLGVSTVPLQSENYRWTVAVDALHPSDDYESMNIGTEFAYDNALFIRAGYQSLFLKDHEGGLCFGLGVTSALLFSENTVIAFDYAYRGMGRLEGVNVFSLSVRF
jgi:hypothetical protein